MNIRKGIGLTVTIASVLMQSSTWAAEHYVDLNSANPTAPYSTWATAATNIQDAVDAAVDDDTVWVTNGTYALTTEITVTNDITIQSVNGAEVSIVDGGRWNRCFNLGDSSCVLEGFTIQNGVRNDSHYDGSMASRSGGGVMCASTNPIVRNCIIRNNYGDNYGGGMYGGQAVNCLFEGNEAYNGGGGMSGPYSGSSTIYDQAIASNCIFRYNTVDSAGGGTYQATAYGCAFIGNTASGGGGMFKSVATDCLFAENKASGSGGGWGGVGGAGGGGMCLGSATNCVFQGNTSNGYGGGAVGGTIINGIFQGNWARRGGGGIGSFYSSNYEEYTALAHAINCTLTENSTAGEGGGLFDTPATNCIVWHNTAGQSGDDLNRHDWIVFTCSPDVVHGADGNITNAPLLTANSRIPMNSPCVGAGRTTAVGSDIDGDPWGNPPSMGCDEPTALLTGPIDIELINLPAKVVVDYDILFSTLVEGKVSTFLVNFGDGHTVTNTTRPSHAWDVPGNYNVVLTAFNDDYIAGVSTTQTIHVASIEGAAVHVAPGGDDLNSGASWAEAKASFQAGVDAQAFIGGSVIVSNGTYHLTQEIAAAKEIVIRGLNGPETCIVDGGGRVRCFNLEGGLCRVQDLTIQNGGRSGVYKGTVEGCRLINNRGGGIEEGTANHCVFKGNTAVYGGGMLRGTANHCVFEKNEAFRGGGISHGIANHCVFRENVATYNGGEKLYGGEPSGGGIYGGTASHSVFIGNTSDGDGGGAHVSSAANCLFTGNRAVKGGGMASISEYSSFGSHFYNPSIAINCTFTQNSAQQDGGALYQAEATNCIAWYNTAGLRGDNLLDDLERVAFTCSPDAIHGKRGNITNAPVMISSSHIAPDSPCVGAGTHLTLGTDLDGSAWKNPPSMGCDEPDETASGTIVLEIAGLPEQLTDTYTADLSFIILGASDDFNVDFGDGHILANTFAVSKRWSAPGPYDVVLTAYNEDYPTGHSITQQIDVVSAQDTAIYVALTGNDTNPGTSWASAKASIQAGVDAQLIPGGSVWVTNGVYFPAEEVLVTNNIVIQSVHGMESTMIDGGGTNRCFNLGDSASILRGLTIMNGSATNNTWTYSDYYGGGIYCSDHTPIVEHCLITNNAARYGGGMYRGTALHSTISDNSARSGGGIHLSKAQQCSLIGNAASESGGGVYRGSIADCTIRGNSAIEYGGGIYSSLAYDCLISENSANLSGGGMYDGTAENCIISENSAVVFGGGMYKGTARNCLIIGNSATHSGGGMRDGSVHHCTISDNSAPQGGGIHYGDAYNSIIINNSAETLGGGLYSGTARQCTISGNSATYGGGIYSGKAYNSIIWNNYGEVSRYFKTYNSTSPSTVQGVNGSITNAPLFVDATSGDYRLQSNSPCINWGNNDYVTFSTDLDGNPRIAGAHVDMGAYEFQTDLGDDANGNGLSDEWERTYFGYPVLPTDNPDSDAAPNGDEYIAGTNPTNAASFFAVTNAALSAEGFVVQWESQEGRRYSVWWSDALTNNFQALATDLPHPINSYTDTVHTVEGASFYQLEVELND